MPFISINVDEEEKKILLRRAKKNLMSLREQAEDIIRRSCVSQKSKGSGKEEKFDDKLVSIFSRRNRGKK